MVGQPPSRRWGRGLGIGGGRKAGTEIWNISLNISMLNDTKEHSWNSHQSSRRFPRARIWSPNTEGSCGCHDLSCFFHRSKPPAMRLHGTSHFPAVLVGWVANDLNLRTYRAWAMRWTPRLPTLRSFRPVPRDRSSRALWGRLGVRSSPSRGESEL